MPPADDEPPPAWVLRAREARASLGAPPPGGPPGGAPPAAVVLTVLTWNLQLLPAQAGRVLERARLAGERILQLAPDVAALQEVWDAPAQGVLCAAFAAAGYAVHAPCEGARCGLLLASKLPILAASFHRFVGGDGPEGWLFDKGVGCALLALPGGFGGGCGGCGGCGGGALAVAHTHTQSDYWRPSAAARARQLREAAARHASLCAAAASSSRQPPTPPVRAALLLGDLNAAGAEAAEALAAMGATDTLAGAPGLRPPPQQQQHHTFPLAVWRRGAYVPAAPTCRLDCVAVLGGRGVARTAAAAEPAMAAHPTLVALSDHAPVVAVVALAPWDEPAQ